METLIVICGAILCVTCNLFAAGCLIAILANGRRMDTMIGRQVLIDGVTSHILDVTNERFSMLEELQRAKIAELKATHERVIALEELQKETISELKAAESEIAELKIAALKALEKIQAEGQAN